MGRQINGALTKLDSVKNWYYSQKFPYWTLYRGQPTTHKTNEAIIARNIDFEEMDEGWSLLENILKEYENGVFTIFAKPKAEGNGGAKILFSPGLVDDHIPGIAGTGSPSGSYPGIGNINSIIEKEKTLWELERKVEDMEATMNAKQPFMEKIFGLLESNMPSILETIVPLLISKFAPVPGAIAGPILHHSEDEETIIENCLGRISVHFDLNEILPKLAAWVEKNPEMAKNLLNNL